MNIFYYFTEERALRMGFHFHPKQSVEGTTDELWYICLSLCKHGMLNERTSRSSSVSPVDTTNVVRLRQKEIEMKPIQMLSNNK